MIRDSPSASQLPKWPSQALVPPHIRATRNLGAQWGIERITVGKASKVMINQRNLAVGRPGRFDPAIALAKALGQWPKPAPVRRKEAADGNSKISVEYLAQEHGLTLGDQNELTIRRVKRGKTYSFVRANGSHVRDTRTIRRLHAMAVPPAYVQ